MQNQRPSTIHDNRYKNTIEILVRERKTAGITQADLAKMTGFFQPDISKIERFERRLDITEFIDLIEAISNGDKSQCEKIWNEINECHRKPESSRKNN